MLWLTDQAGILIYCTGHFQVSRLQTHTGIYNISFLALRPWNYTIGFSDFPACGQQIIGFLSLRNCVSQFLTRNLILDIYFSYLVLFLWRILTSTSCVLYTQPISCYISLHAIKCYLFLLELFLIRTKSPWKKIQSMF